MPPKYTSASRVISGEIIEDKRVNNLPDWLTISAHFRILLKMDNLGRIEAEPEMIKSLIFPRRKPVVSLAKCQKVVLALHHKGLYFLYTKNGDQFLQAAKYDRQRMVGHMQRKSGLPPPDLQAFHDWLVKVRQDDRFIEGSVPPVSYIGMVQDILGLCSNHVQTMLSPGSDHVIPEQEQTMNREDNDGDNEHDTDTEGALAGAQADEGVSVAALINENYPHIMGVAIENLDNDSLPKGGKIEQELKSAMKIHGWRNVEEAIREAVTRNNPRWQYVIGILENWAKERNARRKK